MLRTVVFTLGLIIAAAVLGFQVKQVGGGRETISVKGLAEKPVKADSAEWTLQLQTQGATIPEALVRLRREKPLLDKFLEDAGFDQAARTDSNESVERPRRASCSSRPTGTRWITASRNTWSPTSKT